ncbi:Fur family transcriptional regulator [Zhouia sp. PK063]|uniref:Fur family transcriptional regulator n=1 Tax=Zhouia sp. PK063 TaxID=3373602 RepID=UPI0037958CEC
MAIKRKTQPQQEILKLFKQATDALAADDILKLLPIKVNKTTVYRILDRFVAAGKLHFVTDNEGKAHYALCQECKSHHTLHNHLHFQCQTCGIVECLPIEIAVPELNDYEVHETQFLVIGVCKRCKNISE